MKRNLTDIPLAVQYSNHGDSETRIEGWGHTRFEVHSLCDKFVVDDGELGQLQFVQPMDVYLTLRPVVHNVL